MTNQKSLIDRLLYWANEHARSDERAAADEIERLQLRESQARAILEPLAEHDPAIRQWLKGLPVDTQIEALTRRAEAAEAALDLMQTIDNLTPEQAAKLNERLNIGRVALSGESPSSAEPTAKRAYFETHEPPHCPTCGCGAEKSSHLGFPGRSQERKDEAVHALGVLHTELPEKSVCEPGPIQPEPQDYTVQCRCGWMGKVSALKSLPEFKMGCPTCSAEFVPIDRMTFPARTSGKP